jgi:acyl-CoA synthetase (AMP-forming)/AMP-acid ligase II
MEFNLVEIFEAVAAVDPTRDCIVTSGRRQSYGEFSERTWRLSNLLKKLGLGVRTERAGLNGWESGQDHVALYLYNCPEYLEGMYGSFKARTAPLNVNYRYVEEELLYLLQDSKARAVIYHASFAPILAKVRDRLPDLEHFLQVADESGTPLLEGALDYEEALASVSPDPGKRDHSPDDLYILYTGGTTGMPKGVLWRQSDIYFSALGGTKPGTGEVDSLQAIVDAAGGGARVLPSPPFMHGAAHWASINAFNSGGAIVIQDDTQRLDPVDIWTKVQDERCQALLIVGDAFARPLLDELEKNEYKLDSFFLVISGGAALSVNLKEALIEKIPHLTILDAIGSSETGSQAANMSNKSDGASTGTFLPQPGNCVLQEDLSEVLEPGAEEIGWFAKAGRVPLGYLGDEAKTLRTFPVLGGVRYSVPGDRARHLGTGMIEVLGRDSVTINSGGEKIFAEEVEQALKTHPGVYDTVVVGRPSERWGQEVVALVSLREAVGAPTPELEKELSAAAEKHIARYKLPKAYVFLDEVVRSPSGKADYRWAKAIAAEQAS